MSALEDPTLPLEQNVTRSPLLNTDILVQLDGDLLEDGTFGLRTLEITSDIVRVRERNGATSFQMPIVEIKSARNEPLVGGGRLEVTTKKGEILPLLSYSLHEAARFSEAARGLEQLAKDEPLSINLKQEVTRCPKCSRLLPEKDGICPVCVDRGRTLLRIGRFMKPYRKQAFALAGLSLVTTGINLIPPQLQRLAIDNVLTKDAQGKFTGSLPYLLQMVGIWVAVVGVATVIQVLNGRLISFLAGNIASDLRSSVYRAIEFLQLTYFDKKQVGAITSRVTQDTDRVWGFLVDGVPLLVTNILLVSGISLFMFWINWKLAFAVLSPLPVSIVISTIFWKPVSQMYFRMGQKWAKFHMHLNESLTGIRVMKAFAKEDHEFAKFRIRNDELREVGISADIRAMTVSSAMTAVTSLGLGQHSLLDALRTGRSGLAPCHFETADLPTAVGAVAGLDEMPLRQGDAAFDCRNNRLAAVALETDGFEASIDAAKHRYGPHRIGLFLGTSTSGILQTELAYRERDAAGRLPRDFDYRRTHNTYSLAAFLRHRLGLSGPALVVSCACASTAKAFGNAARMIAAGACDAAIVGGADSLCLTTLYGFTSLALTSTRPCRPFDGARDGISIGEAAGFVLLEREAEARTGHVSFLGIGESNDAYHMSSPHPEGAGARLAIEQALATAGLRPGQIDYINLHGTATPAGDAAEDHAVFGVFGDQVPCSSTKGHTGHTLGAAGIVEAIIAALAIEHGLRPGSPNTETVDPAFRFAYRRHAEPATIERVMSNSFGFGGSNCSLVLGRAH